MRKANSGQARKRLRAARTILIAALALAVVYGVRTPRFGWLINRLQGEKTVEQRLVQYGPTVRARLAPDFRESGVAYPPTALVIVGLKRERVVQVYARSGKRGYRFLKSYPILAASGKLGPKLREGDRQVPEGIYRVTFLNPNSLCHLSLRLDYPNSFDRAMAKRDGRTNLGGEIMIHGHKWSVGCIAVGNRASEDLFVLAADVGIRNVQAILSPVDFRHEGVPATDRALPAWTHRLYRTISAELRKLP